MHGLCSTGASRLAMLLVGLACGAVSAMSAFENGFTQGSTELSRWVFGVGFVAVIGSTWLLPSEAEKAFRSGETSRGVILGFGALLMLGVATLNAIGFFNLHRGDNAAGRQNTVQRYELALGDITRLEGDIKTAKEAKIYKRSAACGNDTEPESRIFCDALRGKERDLKAAKETVNAGRPGAADPQIEQIAWVTGTDAKWTARAWNVVLGAIFEIGACIAFYAAQGGRKELPAPKVAEIVSARPEPSSRLLEVVETKPVKLTRKNQAPALPAPGIKLRKDGLLDQRCSFARQTKKMANA